VRTATHSDNGRTSSAPVATSLLALLVLAAPAIAPSAAATDGSGEAVSGCETASVDAAEDPGSVGC